MIYNSELLNWKYVIRAALYENLHILSIYIFSANLLLLIGDFNDQR